MSAIHRIAAAALGTAVVLAAGGVAHADQSTVVPTRYEAGRFFATPQTTGRRTLRLLVDTGGGGRAGMYLVSRAMASSLRLGTARCEIDGHALDVLPLPRYETGRGVPEPLGPCSTLLVIDEPGQLGMLGASYLAYRNWIFDYPEHRLTAVDGVVTASAGAHATAMNFPVDARGDSTASFPRVTIEIDGESIEMLLDTGATGRPSETAASTHEIDTVDGEGATSFITTQALEDWHRRHSDWPVIERADHLLPGEPMRMIRVPTVTIAGWTTGPVWFTERPTYNFREFMSQWMDKTIEGAVGGNLLRHFVMTLDYANRRAWFACADCP